MMVFCSLCQVTRPDGKPETLGLVVLDEPIAKQSDPTGTVRKQKAIWMHSQWRHLQSKLKPYWHYLNPRSTHSWKILLYFKGAMKVSFSI